MRVYFIHDGENESGPFDINQLKTLNIKRDTPVWHEGLEDWKKAEEIDELQPFINQSKTPPKFDSKSTLSSNITPPNIKNKKNDEETLTNKSRKFSPRKIILTISGIALIILVVTNLITNYERSQQQEGAARLMEAQQNEKTRLNAEISAKNKNYRNNWQDYISVTNNEYKYYSLGGIEDLEVIATNNTEYKIDEMTIDVCYIIDNGTCFKNEEVTIYNIPPNSTKSVSAPNSTRGKSVQLTVMGIYSDEMNFSFAPGNWAKDSDDPYFSKEKR